MTIRLRRWGGLLFWLSASGAAMPAAGDAKWAPDKAPQKFAGMAERAAAFHKLLMRRRPRRGGMAGQIIRSVHRFAGTGQSRLQRAGPAAGMYVRMAANQG